MKKVMENSRTQTLFKGMSIQTIITAIMGVLEIISFSIMSRLLTKSDFGYFAAISGIMAICISISEAGLGAAVIQKKGTSQPHVSTAFTLSIILGFTGSLIVFILAPNIATLVADETLVIPLRLISSNIFMHSLISVGNALLYKQLNFKRIGINSIIAYTVSTSIGIGLACMGYGLYAVVSASIFNSIILVILLYGFSIKIPNINIDRKEAKGIVSFGGWLTIGVILNNISQQLDKLVLSKWISVEALGSYNRPVGFISTINMKIQSIFDSVLFPMLSDIQDNKATVTNVFYRAVSLLNSFSIILAAVSFFNAELIIAIFFGKEWLDLVPIMQIASLGVIFSIDSRLVDCFFRSLNLVKLGTQIRAMGIVIMLTSLYIGAQHGIIGVAWGIFIANLILVFIKMIALAIKVNAKISQMFITWIKSWKVAILPIILGCIYLLISSGLDISNVIFAFIWGSVIIIEFVFYPKMVGDEYLTSIYPIVEKIKKRIFK